MQTHRLREWMLIILFALLLIIPGGRLRGQSDAQSGQSGATPQAQGGPIRVSSSLVNLFATVRDAHHAIVGNLTQDDFKLFEDGQEQKIAFFENETKLPITLGILVDTSGSQSDVLLAEQNAASRFVNQVMRKKDEAMVMSFDSDVDLLADWTDDKDILERAIRRTVINAVAAGTSVNGGIIPQNNTAGTALYDAVYLACNEKMSPEAGRKAIVILTDGQDEGSKLKLEDAIEAAQRADTVIHVLLLAEPSGYFQIGEAYIGGHVAKKMADETGGRVIEVRNTRDLDKAFDQISEELRSQYTLGYYPSNGKRDGTFRKIKVDTTKSGLKALARKGYYAPKG
ncbi:MAG: VWA domain-containing protein [Candidatus Acidiferrales bacterium]